jgi:hypothetical protein
MALNPKVSTLHPLLEAVARQGFFISWVKTQFSNSFAVSIAIPHNSFLRYTEIFVSKSSFFATRAFAHLSRKSIGFEKELCGRFTQGRCETHQRYNHIPPLKLDFGLLGSRVEDIIAPYDNAPAFTVLGAQSPTLLRASVSTVILGHHLPHEGKEVQRKFIHEE